MLAQIRDELPDLRGPAGLQIRHTGERVGSYRTKASASPALIRLDVMAMLDPNSRTDETGLTNVDQALGGWAARVRDHLAGWSADQSPDDYAPWAHWLIDRAELLMRYPAVDECFTDVADLHRHVMRAAGYEASGSQLGRCLSSWVRVSVNGADPVTVDCGHMVYARVGEPAVKCGRCGRAYSGVDQLRLKHQGC